jgi:hypothetical protein
VRAHSERTDLSSPRALAALILVVLLGLGWAPRFGAAAGSDGDSRTVKGKAQSDGVVTPGGFESLTIRGMPKRLPFQIVVGPVPASPNCQGRFVCEPEFGERAPGTAKFRTSARGRASVFFKMPTTYLRRQLGKPGSARTPFADGEQVRIQANGFTIDKRVSIVGIAVTGAVVDLP